MVKEGTCYLRTKHEHLKEYKVKIIGSDIYFYKPSNTLEHKIMHCLIGAFISKSQVNEDGGKTVYSVKISIGN